MEYKILEANGVENENVDGAAFNNFSSKGKNGIIRGILNECDVHLLNSSTVEISSGELLIQGFRIKIIEPYTAKRDASASPISHQLIARIRLSSDRSVSFEIECRSVAPLQQDSLFKNELGIYEVEIATFKTDQNGISNLIRILSIIDSRAELGTSGGRTGQVLKKMSDLDYDYGWEDEDTSLYASLSSEVSKNRKRITNLELGLPEDRFQTDASVAYTKNVPENALPYAAISKVGGMTRKCTNLIPYPYYHTTITTNGITFTDNGDGSINITGTATENAVFYFIYEGQSFRKPIKAGNYTISITGNGSADSNIRFTVGVTGVSEYYAYLNSSTTNFTVDKETTMHVKLSVNSGTTVNATVYPMLNPGDTALPYEPYFEGLRSAPVTEIESVGVNLLPYPYTILKDSDYGDMDCIEFIDNGDGGIIVDGTNYADEEWYTFTTVTLPKGKYCFSFCSNYDEPELYDIVGINGAEHGVDYKILSGGSYSGTPIVFEVFKTTTFNLKMGFWDDTFEPITVYPMLNYGATPKLYVPYSGKHTLPIPEAVQSLEGYGWGVNDTCYNYIDWENKQFVKRVVKVDLGTLDWEYNGVVFVTFSGLDAKGRGIECICVKYTNSGYVSSDDMPDKTYQTQTSNYRLWIKDSAYSDAAAFKAAMSGVMLYYELAEPIVTDISNILSDDNLIKVEGGGTITMVNEHKYAVPSEVIYQMKEVAE